MDSYNSNYEVICCPEDDEYRVYCDNCHNQGKERFFENHLKSQIQTNNIRTREQLHKSFQVNLFIYMNIKNHKAIC